MTNAAEGVRAELRATLAAGRAFVCERLRVELAREVTLERGRFLQFEVDPWSWEISSCASEAQVTEVEWLSERLPAWIERAGEADLNVDALLSEEVCPWFAGCWQEVGGPARFSPAYVFIHGSHEQQYDLERLRWVASAVVFGE